MARKFCPRIAALALLLVSMACAFAESSSQPVITKIDPPNWWPSLPDPMLLVYGRDLANAHFAVSGTGVRLLRSRTSTNGHYAFLWLATRSAAPQRLRISATNSAGSADSSFELKARKPARGLYQGFSPADVIYLIMTDRFADGDPSNNQPGYAPDAVRGWHGGDFRGIRNHLDYLQQLGVTTLWTTPIVSNGNMPDSYHGYASVDLYAVDSHFGTLSDYQALAAELHSRGMKILFDIVPNHIGSQHPWVHDPPTPDWFHGTFEHHPNAKSNFEALVDPHSATASWQDITHGWFTDYMPDMNQENPLVAAYFIQNAIWWVETASLDGFRIDTFPYVGRAFWHDFHQQLHNVYPRLTTVGEVFNGDVTITSYFAGGATHAGIDTGLYTPFDFPVYFTLRDVLVRDRPMSAIASMLGQDHLYPHPDRLVTFFGNHDTRRFLSESGATPARLKLAFALAATLRGTPELYSGDEIAMEGGDDPDNRRDFPGGFSSSSHNAFTPAGRTAGEQAVFSFASQMLHLRASHPAMATGELQNLFADATAIAFLRGNQLSHGCKSPGGAERVLVLVSKAPAARTIDLDAAGTGLESCANITPLFPEGAQPLKINDGKLSVPVDSDGVAIYSVR